LIPFEKKLLGGPLSPVAYVLASPGHFQSRVKILGRSTPLGAKIWYSEKVNLVGKH